MPLSSRNVASRQPAFTAVNSVQAIAGNLGDSQKTRSEPDRQVYETSDSDRATLAAIAEIIAQGDRNTAQLNACIDSYNKVMGIMNGK